MSASDNEEKCDSGREGDVADEMENTNGVLEDRHTVLRSSSKRSRNRSSIRDEDNRREVGLPCLSCC